MDTLLRQALTLTNLRAARDRVLANNGCAGVDGQTVLDFAALGDAPLRELARDVQAQRYRPQPLLRLWIPRREPERPSRGLAVPTVRDRVLQTSVATALTPLAEAQAEDVSFAYRRGRSVQQAVARVERYMREGWRWVVEADIESFFDRIDHTELEKLLARLLPNEPRLLALLAQWLRTPISDNGVLQQRTDGVPQGSPVSPLLSNLYLDELDEALIDANHRLVRFADDFVVLARTQERAEAALALTRETLENLALRLNPLKTRVIHSDQGFGFLGWNFVRTLAIPKQRAAADEATSPASVSSPATDARPPVETLADLSELPDEILDEPSANPASTTQETDDDPPLPALAPLQRTLYLVDPGVRLEVDNRRLAVREGPAGAEKTRLMLSPLSVDQVIVFGPVQVTTQALQLVARSGGAVGFLSGLGRYYGRYEGADGAALGLLESQFERSKDPAFATAMARRLVAAKLRNCALVIARTLRRHKPGNTSKTSSPGSAGSAGGAHGAQSITAQADLSNVPARLREAADGAERARDLASLRGIEGAAAALHFQSLAKLLPAEWGFTHRVARPAPCAINALLSFGYSLLYQCVAGLLRARGLHAHLGLFHASGGAHMALASDLMEPYRAYAVDATVLRLVFTGKLEPGCGAVNAEGTFRLDAVTQRAFIHAIETRFNAPQTHPRTREPMDFKRMVDADIRQLAQALRDGEPGGFWPAVWD